MQFRLSICLFSLFTLMGFAQNNTHKILYLSSSCNNIGLDSLSLKICDTNFQTSKTVINNVFETVTLSHAKNKIAYLKPYRQAWSNEICITDIDGGNNNVVYNYNPNISVTKSTHGYFNLTTPVWSPDDSKLVFIKSKIDYRVDLSDLVKQFICILNLKTNTIDSIKTNEHIYSIYWANDSAHLLYLKDSYAKKYITGYFNSRGQYYRLFSLNLTTKEEKALTDSTMNYVYFETSPKSNKILFTAYPQRQLYIMNIDGTNKKQLTHFNYTDTLNDGLGISCIKWSPDGEKIAFMQGFKNKSKIYVINADGTELKMVPTPVPEKMFGPISFLWQSNGKSLLVRYTWTCVDNQLYSISIDGKTTKQVNNNINFNNDFIYKIITANQN